MSYSKEHLLEAAEILSELDAALCDKAVELLETVRARGGRLFILGVGGSAANASHAVNDFRKIAGMGTLRRNRQCLRTNRPHERSGMGFCFHRVALGKPPQRKRRVSYSVGRGRQPEKNVSPNLVAALQLAKKPGAALLGIVGRDGGYTARVADVAIMIPTVNPVNVTPHFEAFQAVVWHLWVSHPALKVAETKWESTK